MGVNKHKTENAVLPAKRAVQHFRFYAYLGWATYVAPEQIQALRTMAKELSRRAINIESMTFEIIIDAIENEDVYN